MAKSSSTKKKTTKKTAAKKVTKKTTKSSDSEKTPKKADAAKEPKAPKAPKAKAVKAPKPPKAPKAPKAPREVPKIDGPIATFAQAVRWLYEHTDLERLRLIKYEPSTFSLDRMRHLLKLLDDPQNAVRFVQIAGTKGKGSTVAMLSGMLRGCGYTVGAYTSPHLVDVRERIAVNDDMIGPTDFTELMRLIQEKTGDLADKDKPTFFEILTAAAIKHFANQAVDVAILEVGLGGRLDATTVVTPAVCAITQISLDHTNILGSTLEAIAAEKAGIMKKGVPVFTVEQTPEVLAVFREKAAAVEAPLHIIGEDVEFSYRFEATRELGPHTRVCLATADQNYDHLPVPLKGEHQALNCGLAIALLDAVCERRADVTEENIIRGLAMTTLAGRMEKILEEPRVMIDGAHNGASITSLIRSIGAHVPYDSLVMIFGCGEDKDVTGMLEQINLGADKIIFTRAKLNPRAVMPRELHQRFAEISGKMAQVTETLPEALNLAARAVGREDLIVVTGSFYLAGEAKKYITDLRNKQARQRAN